MQCKHGGVMGGFGGVGRLCLCAEVDLLGLRACALGGALSLKGK